MSDFLVWLWLCNICRATALRSLLSPEANTSLISPTFWNAWPNSSFSRLCPAEVCGFVTKLRRAQGLFCPLSKTARPWPLRPLSLAQLCVLYKPARFPAKMFKHGPCGKWGGMHLTAKLDITQTGRQLIIQPIKRKTKTVWTLTYAAICQYKSTRLFYLALLLSMFFLHSTTYMKPTRDSWINQSGKRWHKWSNGGWESARELKEEV